MLIFNVEYTDTHAGEANYAWVRRARVIVPELTHYGYDGSNGAGRALKIQTRELMRRAKAAMGLTGTRGVRESIGDTEEFRPHGCNTVLFVSPADVESEP